MFDIGFTELLVVGVVAILVVGPDKLPSLVKTTLIYIRKIKTGFNNIKEDVERELDLDELTKDVSQSKKEMQKMIGYDDLQSSLTSLKEETDSLRNIAKDGYEYAEDDDLDDEIDDVSDEDIENDMESFNNDDEFSANLHIEEDIDKDISTKSTKHSSSKQKIKSKQKKEAK